MSPDDVAWAMAVEDRAGWGLADDEDPPPELLAAIQRTAMFHVAHARLRVAEAERALEVAVEDLPAWARVAVMGAARILGPLRKRPGKTP